MAARRGEAFARGIVGTRELMRMLRPYNVAGQPGMGFAPGSDGEGSRWARRRMEKHELLRFGVAGRGPAFLSGPGARGRVSPSGLKLGRPFRTSGYTRTLPHSQG